MPSPPLIAIALRALGYGALFAAIIVGVGLWDGEPLTRLLPLAAFALVVDGLIVWGRVRRDVIRRQRGEIALNDLR